MRAGRGKDLPLWPNWCYLPMAGFYAIVSEDSGGQRVPLNQIGDIARLAAIGTWRVTQGIYRFDPAVYDAVRETTLDKAIPCAVLHRIPEWCVYIETPEMVWDGIAVHGAWAHIEWDANDGRSELRFLVDMETGLVPLILHIGDWSLTEALDKMIAETGRVAGASGNAALSAMYATVPLEQVAKTQMPIVQPLVALLLYLCSQNSEIGDGTKRPGNPKSQIIRGIPRIFQSERVSVWDVGVRMGSALRRAYQAEQVGSGTHAGPRPHVRRAHWHGFWSGPLESKERKFDLRWLPPIAVNVDDAAALPAVIRPVG